MAEITKELRAWAEEFPLHGGPLACVLACADRIDERHEDELGAARAKVESEYDGWYPPRAVEGMRRFAERLEAAASERADVTIFGVDYMPYPLDADGVPIHVGDWITGEWDAKAKVEAVTSDDVYWWEPDGCHWCHASEVRHHHAPTVEDVLREFAHVGIRIAAKHGIKAGEIDFYADEDAIAEYAAKLTLRGDE